jgi:hypothetical protein
VVLTEVVEGIHAANLRCDWLIFCLLVHNTTVKPTTTLRLSSNMESADVSPQYKCT